ncbi:hypothetical protein [Pontimicrobium sp. MEBiC01747]
MEIVDRILEIQKEVTKSQRSFELSIGKTSGYFNVIRRNKSTPGVDLILKIIEIYPEYNLNWIMTGKGDRYNKGVEVNKVSEGRSHYITKETGPIEEIIEKLAEEKMHSFIEAQDKKLTDLSEAISDIKKSINDIKKKVDK